MKKKKKKIKYTEEWVIKVETTRDLLNYLADKGAFDKDYINWLIEKDFRKENKF